MPSVRKSYDEELLQLDTLLARMGHEAGAAIESALTALRNDDIELARSVVARDSQIDAGEHEIEHRLLHSFLNCLCLMFGEFITGQTYHLPLLYRIPKMHASHFLLCILSISAVFADLLIVFCVMC